MYYINPASLQDQSFESPFDNKTVQRLRKKLLAELELAGSDILSVEGRSFTKSELLDYFEELQQENIINYHLAISKDPALLRFLQSATIDDGARFISADIYNDPDFIDWISRYFHSAFIQLATDCFNLTDAAAMRTILDNRMLMTGHDTEQTWLLINDILDRNIALFDHYRGRGQKTSPSMMPVTRISAYIGHGYLNVIKQLPDSRFARMKDVYAHSMLHPSIAVFNRDVRNRSLSVIWVEEALMLAVSPEVKKRIQAKLDEFNHLLEKNDKKNSSRLIYVIVILIAIFTSLFNTCNSEPSTTTPSPDPAIVPYPLNPVPLIASPSFLSIRSSYIR